MLSSVAPMRFWSIQQTRADLIEGRVGERETFRYIFASLLLLAYSSAYFGHAQGREAHSWSGISTLLGAISAAVGVYVAFRANGGASGRNFAARYFALSWVLYIRFMAGVAPLVVTMVVLATHLPVMVVRRALVPIGIAYLGLFYWRMYVHVKEVAEADPSSA